MAAAGRHFHIIAAIFLSAASYSAPLEGVPNKIDPRACDKSDESQKNAMALPVTLYEPIGAVFGGCRVWAGHIPPNSYLGLGLGEVARECEQGSLSTISGLCSLLGKNGATQDTCQRDQESPAASMLREYAAVLLDKGLVPLVSSGDSQLDAEIAFGIVLANTGSPDESIQHFSAFLKDHPDVIAAYHGRGSAYARKGLQYKINAELALADFTKAIELDRKLAESYERRAEILSPIGRGRDAIVDLDIAINLEPTARRFFRRGTLNFLREHYTSAQADFKKSLEKDSNQPNVLHFLGLAVFHRGALREAAKIFENVIKANPEYVEAIRNLGQVYRELGDYEKAMEQFNTALILDDKHVQGYQFRGSLYYHSGRPFDALRNFKKCLALEPHNEPCQYMTGLSNSAIGRFYHGIKAQTKVMLNEPIPGQKVSQEYQKVYYLREYSRYTHAHLEVPAREFSLDADLNGDFKDRWAKNLIFTVENYTEQPGLQPQISDVVTPDFSSYTPEVQRMVCRAYSLGQLMQFTVDGYLPNVRVHAAMGLAALEVMQTAQAFWKAPKTFKTPMGKKFHWRDIFDTAVKWRRLIDPEQPVLWLDLMPAKSVDAGFNNFMNMIRGQVTNIRYSGYLDTTFKLTKQMVMHYQDKLAQLAAATAATGAQIKLPPNLPHPNLKAEISKTQNCEELLEVMKQKSGSSTQNGFMVGTHVPSLKDKKRNKNYDGLMLTLSGDTEGNILFSMDTATTKTRTSQYHSEMEWIWNRITDEVKKGGNGMGWTPPDGSGLAPGGSKQDVDTLVNTILYLVYYFYNLLPLSRGSSVVAYTVAMGMLMALGKEVTGKIPPGKMVDMEAMLTGSPESFANEVKDWMNLKRLSPQWTHLPKVSDTFPTFRSMIEVLNQDLQTACSKEGNPH
ncbi:tetratricopeptide repeat protein 13-like isoform X1 [Branchiostoma floridae]|uniref:Tetratricopeptide repeat protein 13-like isoform X1 n=1 Tax=Branchiostoma floridae TaxID=7739 RepID=A0A9J7LKQ5_BRAFL|nr:tetratricopeptide repeat protein 13-like isoform X1 [Branchiostoma floridae]